MFTSILIKMVITIINNYTINNNNNYHNNNNNNNITTGGDFPEEMGANLESGLMMENENALKSRKDEDSDE